MQEALFAWCPFIALLVGALCTLGFFRSRNWGLGLVFFGLAAQVLAWTVFFLAGEVTQHGWTAEWQNALGAGFVQALIGVVPYTAIGAVCGAVLVALVRFSVRQEVEQVEEVKEEAAEREAEEELAKTTPETTNSARGWD
jgi:hypothetical protein